MGLNKNPLHHKISGAGAGLRAEHFSVFLGDAPPKVSWLEILADNYLDASGMSFDKVRLIAAQYPTVLHCVNAGVGNSDPINWDYVRQIKTLIDALNPAWVSDHLCWTALNGHHSHSLLPLPFTKNIAHYVGERIARMQDYFERSFLIENIAAYVRTPYDDLSEVDFLNLVTQVANCGILLDVNNLYVNAQNHGESADIFLRELNADRVMQYHLAGYAIDQDYCIDTHDQPIREPVWSLYTQTVKIIGVRPACIEWDSDVPAWGVLAEEIKKINHMAIST